MRCIICYVFPKDGYITHKRNCPEYALKDHKSKEKKDFDYVGAIVKAAPPLTDNQISKLRILLREK